MDKPKPVTRPRPPTSGNPKKTTEHIKPKPSYKKEKAPIRKPKQSALTGFLGGLIQPKTAKKTVAKKTVKKTTKKK